MPVSRKRKNAGKGAGARERNRRRAQRNRAVRAAIRGDFPTDQILDDTILLAPDHVRATIRERLRQMEQGKWK